MKKVLTLMLGLVAGTASFAHTADVNPTVSATHLVMTTDQKIKLYVQPAQDKGDLSIRDANGHVLYNTTVSLQKGLQQQFDISNLGTGMYQLTLNTNHQTLTKTFVVQANPNVSFVVQD
ncbi:T9SS type A sorting domain-containing protein [Spirosoma sp. KUDC1026]|uniref:T9SS type A sorting domain-containing protein n=1 Tax=Spirosoma sp. KUDC1026 TaxID=2745947 RepID=UPI00159BCF4E|nr:T9SS type A sorting domain-containing protein [Spirosoma sp. KUDC1026]QKZ14848.1 T9SS type A sorting domain-containing protein [Spirosoma sp. KUDC1026]